MPQNNATEKTEISTLKDCQVPDETCLDRKPGNLEYLIKTHF